jgi:hypothetical protein
MEDMPLKEKTTFKRPMPTNASNPLCITQSKHLQSIYIVMKTAITIATTKLTVALPCRLVPALPSLNL